MRDEHILAAVFGEPWAILPDKLVAIQAVVQRHLAGVRLSAEQLDALVQAAARPEAPQTQGAALAVFNVFGVIAQRMNLMSAFSGGMSTERLARDFQSALTDPQVGTIVLNVDSPGGSVFGVPELADTIFRARGKKPIVAVANSMMASAAYWIASQADEIVVSPSSLTGSIGVIASHVDESEALAREGRKVTYITAGKYKAEGNSTEPLNDEAHGALQDRVDAYYGMFVNAVARGRGVKASEVRTGYGEGRVLNAQEAVKVGLADRVGTLEETITRLTSGKRGTSSTRAEEQPADNRADIDLRRRRHRLNAHRA